MGELGFAVMRFNGDGSHLYRHYISLLCPQDYSVSENLRLPFSTDVPVEGCSGSGGLLSFCDMRAKIIICNLTTRRMKELPLPEFKSTPNSVVLNGCGLACDAQSGDYKVVRTFCRYYYDEDEAEERTSYKSFEICSHLYLSTTGAWKDIESPAKYGHITSCAGVYIRNAGCCYWMSLLKLSDGKREPGVVSFNFATESFSCLLFPQGSDFTIIDHCGSLGAINQLGYRKSYSSEAYYELFVWTGTCMWTKLRYISVPLVGSPLCFINDYMVLFDKKCKRTKHQHQRRGELVLYDLDKDEEKNLNIHDCLQAMRVYSYVKTIEPLPGSRPMDRDEAKTMRRKAKGMGMKLHLLNMKLMKKMKMKMKKMKMN